MKIGKRSLFSLLLIAGLSFLLVGKSAYSQDIGAQAGRSKVWVGAWFFDIDWNCDGTLEATKAKAVLDSKGNCIIGSLPHGTWTGTKKKITIKLNGGCMPVWVGTMKTKGNAVGTMKCTSGTDDGCWAAARSSKSVSEEETYWFSSPDKGNVPQELDSVE